jgi:Ca-activated chloride channel family protein
MTLFSVPCFAADKAALVREGNKLYNDGKIDEALKNYNQALTAAPDEPLVNFNIASGLYKKSQYGDAIKTYEKAFVSSDKKIEAQANYNIGNCKFRQGRVKESSDLQAAIIEYRQSLDYYKRAMELDPEDKDAKFNHEFVERYLKSLLDKLKKQQEQKQQQQKEGQEGKEGQQAEQQKEQQQTQQAKEAKQPEQKGQEQQYQPGGDIAKEDPHAGAGKGADKEMSKEQARMLLDDSRQQEIQERQLSDKQASMRYPDVEKDW